MTEGSPCSADADYSNADRFASLRVHNQVAITLVVLLAQRHERLGRREGAVLLACYPLFIAWVLAA